MFVTFKTLAKIKFGCSLIDSSCLLVNFLNYILVGTLFIDIGTIYSFGTGLLKLMSKDTYQYCPFE